MSDIADITDKLRKFAGARKQLGSQPCGYDFMVKAAELIESKDKAKPKDFGIYVCLNNETSQVALCGWCAATKRFKNLHDDGSDFDATHWWEKPAKNGELL